MLVLIELGTGEGLSLAAVRGLSPAKRDEKDDCIGESTLDDALIAQAVRSSPGGVLVYDSSGDCIAANEAAAAMAGATVKALLAQNYRKLDSWRLGGLTQAADEALSARSAVTRLVHMPSSFGRELRADFHFSAFDYRGATYLLAVVVELRDHSLAEAPSVPAEERLALRTLRDQAADKELESFFYGVTHDLRAPLRAIGGFASILAEDEAARLSAEGRRLLGTIRGNVERMESLIEDLLIFARLSKAEVESVEVDMASLARTAFDESVAEEDRDRIDFSLSVMPRALGDPRLLKQIWVNLISNAVKFSSKRERAHISVEGRRANGELVYSVTDDGVGFDMKYYEKLFGIFQRLHSARDFEGSGMGLAFVQRALIKQGGRAWAEGEVGLGARFCFALPKPEARARGLRLGPRSLRLGPEACGLREGIADRELVDQEPVIPEAGHGIGELIEIYRLHNVAVGAQGIGLLHVGVLPRGSHDHDGDAAGLLVLLDRREHLEPVDLGQLQVQEDDLRLAHQRAACVNPAAEEEVQRRLAVVDPVDGVRKVALLESPHCEVGVLRIVLDEEDLYFHC